MTYESMHTIPNWDTHEANCDTDDPNRETYTTRTILAIQTIRGPDGRKVCIKGPKTYEIVTRIIIKYIQFIYTRNHA